MKYLVQVGMIAVLVLFTLYGFVIEQPCGPYDRNLWCYLHPFTFLDLLGCILFYGGFVFRIVSDYFDLYVGNVGGASFWAWAFWVSAAAGVGLMFIS